MELMIVVGIIGVLATLAMPRFRQFQAKAKMAEAKNNLTHIFTLQQSYHLDTNNFVNFARYGRQDNGSVNCVNGAAPQGAQDIGFEIAPCDGNNAPVPRYGYEVTGADRANFNALAASGTNANNLVCPGQPAHGFTINQDKSMSDDGIGNTPAMRRCF